jgi:hypothetical protein
VTLPPHGLAAPSPRYSKIHLQCLDSPLSGASAAALARQRPAGAGGARRPDGAAPESGDDLSRHFYRGVPFLLAGVLASLAIHPFISSEYIHGLIPSRVPAYNHVWRWNAAWYQPTLLRVRLGAGRVAAAQRDATAAWDQVCAGRASRQPDLLASAWVAFRSSPSWCLGASG